MIPNSFFVSGRNIPDDMRDRIEKRIAELEGDDMQKVQSPTNDPKPYPPGVKPDWNRMNRQERIAAMTAKAEEWNAVAGEFDKRLGVESNTMTEQTMTLVEMQILQYARTLAYDHAETYKREAAMEMMRAEKDRIEPESNTGGAF